MHPRYSPVFTKSHDTCMFVSMKSAIWPPWSNFSLNYDETQKTIFFGFTLHSRSLWSCINFLSVSPLYERLYTLLCISFSDSCFVCHILLSHPNLNSLSIFFSLYSCPNLSWIYKCQEMSGIFLSTQMSRNIRLFYRLSCYHRVKSFLT